MRAGSKIRLVNMEITKVVDVSKPNAMVPPKEENAKMMKPAKSTTEVYIMLLPVSIILSLTATGMKKLFDHISCRYFARNLIELSTEIPNVILNINAVLAFSGMLK